MSRIAYVNGRYCPHGMAHVHIEDRGYQFADGVYEVMAVRGGLTLNSDRHFARLARSLGELRIEGAPGQPAIAAIIAEVIRRNRLENGIVYLQITRGVATRDHPFPKKTKPSLVVTARRLKGPSDETRRTGIRVITVPDMRWGRCDIKSVSLLANVLAKQTAREQGAFEAWLVDDSGNVTEGSSTNAWIVDRDGNLVTRYLDNAILSGVTRLVLKDLAHETGHKLIERPFSVAEAKAAPEAFLTSTTSAVLPIVRIDEAAIGSGAPGPVSRRLQEMFAARSDSKAGR
jgi:D-alanine transaminase